MGGLLFTKKTYASRFLGYVYLSIGPVIVELSDTPYLEDCPLCSIIFFLTASTFSGVRGGHLP